MNTQSFDATAAIGDIREQRASKRRRSFRRSRLARYRSEIVAMRKQGASYSIIAAWLRSKRIKVARTTVLRYLAKLPELKEGEHAQLP